MDLQTLKSEHPEVYAAAFDAGRKEGHAAGHKEGVEHERDRVSAHLIRGKASGAMDLAVECVENGSAMTETLRAKYDTAKQNRADDSARQADSDSAGEAVDNAKPVKEKAKSMQTEVADILCAEAGITG